MKWRNILPSLNLVSVALAAGYLVLVEFWTVHNLLWRRSGSPTSSNSRSGDAAMVEGCYQSIFHRFFWTSFATPALMAVQHRESVK